MEDGREAWGFGWLRREAHAVVDYANTIRRHAQQVSDLSGGETGDGNDEIAPGCGVARLRRETRPELGRRVVAAHDEQIVECGNRLFQPSGGQALVEPVKQITLRQQQGRQQKAPADVGRIAVTSSLRKAVRAVTMQKPSFRMDARQAV